MAEQYIEQLLMRQDNKEHVEVPTFSDSDIDAVFEFEGRVRLVQISKQVSNATHNLHQYIFKIESIGKFQKE
jgi:hypothetical protein